jgi:hypothetical protein
MYYAFGFAVLAGIAALWFTKDSGTERKEIEKERFAKYLGGVR